MNFKEKFSEIFLSKQTKFNKVYIALIAGVLLLLLSSTFFESKNEKTSSKNENVLINETKKVDDKYIRSIEDRLVKTLEKIEGAGKVRVLVTMEKTSEISLAKNEKTDEATENEKSQNNSFKVTTNKDSEILVLKGKSSFESPVVLSETEPKVLGVLVLAEGGDNKNVTYAIYKSVKALLSVSPNRIEVYKMAK